MHRRLTAMHVECRNRGTASTECFIGGLLVFCKAPGHGVRGRVVCGGFFSFLSSTYYCPFDQPCYLSLHAFVDLNHPSLSPAPSL